MSDSEDFLTRWSRRKRAAAEEPEKSPRKQDGQHATNEQHATNMPPADQPAGASVSRRTATSAAPAEAAEPVFDLSKLPSIDSITAETDIRAFLAPGVPAELRLAALRRAWVTDPTVRDFVGLNDYDFDFHTPGAIPGFGSLEMTDELRRELAQMISGWQSEPQMTQRRTTVAAASDQPQQQVPAALEKNEQLGDSTETAPMDAGVTSEHPAPAQDELIPEQATTHCNKVPVASQQDQPPAENLQRLARRGHGRGHGRALPK